MTAPKRPWVRFSLRAMFAVTAILGWALACRPYWVHSESRIEVSRQEFLSGGGAISRNITGGGIASDDDQPRVYYFTVERSWPNPYLLGPAAALAVFIVWTRFLPACTR
jgi:hypothetical protein